jgi:hypothetical protein
MKTELCDEQKEKSGNEKLIFFPFWLLVGKFCAVHWKAGKLPKPCFPVCFVGADYVV